MSYMSLTVKNLADLITVPQNLLRSITMGYKQVSQQTKAAHGGVYINTCKHVWCFSVTSDMNMIIYIQSRSQLDGWLV